MSANGNGRAPRCSIGCGSCWRRQPEPSLRESIAELVQEAADEQRWPASSRNSTARSAR